MTLNDLDNDPEGQVQGQPVRSVRRRKGTPFKRVSFACADKDEEDEEQERNLRDEDDFTPSEVILLPFEFSATFHQAHHKTYIMT